MYIDTASATVWDVVFSTTSLGVYSMQVGEQGGSWMQIDITGTWVVAVLMNSSRLIACDIHQGGHIHSQGAFVFEGARTVFLLVRLCGV
jgi:hypothetical protein